MNNKQVNQSDRKKGTKWKVLLIVFLIIFVSMIVFIGHRFISNKINKFKATKFNNTLNELTKERIDYVFIEINPSFVLTIKDSKVSDVACLNEDCVSIYENIDIKGKNINVGIDTIYNVSKEKGFDVSNGIKIQTFNNVNIETKDYITVERIDSSKEKELLEEVKNNVEIKNINNDDYYTHLWEELKKDKDYDNIYSCNMVDRELKCYFAEKFLTASEENNANGLKSSDLSRTLDKFGIKYESWNWGIDFGDAPYGLYLNGQFYYLVNQNLEYYGNIPECEQYKSGQPTDYITCALVYGKAETTIQFPQNKLNLLTLQFDN